MKLSHSIVVLAVAFAYSVCRGQADVAVTRWVKQNAVKLDTVEAGHGFDDMQPIKAMVGSARVVGLGEATHGTREFFQLKHRMVEFLVEQMGFTIFGIEASYPDCIAINDFVLHGKGDPAVALRHQGFWTWNTEEVFAMIKWMRAYNADPEHEKKILFYGFDMQAFDSASDFALKALAGFDPTQAHQLRSRFGPLMDRGRWDTLNNLGERSWDNLADAVNDLVWGIEAHRDEFVAKVHRQGYDTIHQHAVVARQCFEMLRGNNVEPHSGRNRRDSAMAANVKWIADRHPGQRLIVWAHNGHISKFGPSMGGQSLGSELDSLFGTDYVNFGFSFCQGTLQAVTQPLSGAPPDWRFDLRTHHAAMAPRGSVGRTFAHTGIPIFAIDLRRVPEGGDVRTWLTTPQPMRSVGSVYNERMAGSYFAPTALLDHFDCILFVESTTCAVGMPDPK